MRKKLAVVVALLMIMSLSVAGCTKTKTTTTAPATPPNEQLARYIEQYNTSLKSEHPNLTAWLVTQINGTSAKIQDAWTDAPSSTGAANVTYSENATVMMFGSPGEATTYVNSQNTGYRLVATSYPSTISPEASQRAKGNATSIYAIYTTGNGVGAPSKQIVQIDQFVWVGDYQYLPSAL